MKLTRRSAQLITDQMSGFSQLRRAMNYEEFIKNKFIELQLNAKPITQSFTHFYHINIVITLGYPSEDGPIQIAVSKRDSAGSSPFTLIHQVTPGARISASLSLGSSNNTNGFSLSQIANESNGLNPMGLVMKTENQVKSFVSRIPPLGRSGSSEFKGISETKVMNLFAKYKDPNEDAILPEGVESFCLDLELKPDEFKVKSSYLVYTHYYLDAVVHW